MRQTRFFERCNRSYQYLNEMCAQITAEYSDITFSVVQCDPNFRCPIQIVHLIKDISDFYNENWQGNKDYLHIPNTKKVFENYLHYPIIMAYKTYPDGYIDILGVTTLKYYQNTATNVNPYYPIPGKRFFEVTGIITKRNSEEKNIGKKIYEIIIEALEKYQEIMPDFDIIFVADCRNYMSINGARGGARYIREEHHKDTYGKLIGFYTVRNDGLLTEAPTFVAKFENTNHSSNPIEFAYEESPEMFESMLTKIKYNLNSFNINRGIINHDDCGEVEFYELANASINLDDVTILPNGTEKGNDRIPEPTRKRMKVGGNNV